MCYCGIVRLNNNHLQRKIMKKTKVNPTSLKAALAQIEKDFGEGAIMKYGEMDKLKVSVISSGSLSVDLALGVGG